MTFVGCGDPPCSSGTLFVMLSFVGGAANADSLDIALTVDEGTAQHLPVNRTPGRSSDSVTIRFAKGYPAGHTIRLTIVALDSFVAPRGCGLRSLTLDDSAGDLAQPPLEDLGTAMPDLAPPADLRLYRSLAFTYASPRRPFRSAGTVLESAASGATRPIAEALDPVAQTVADTMLQARSEAWWGTTAYYTALQGMARSNPQLRTALQPAVDFFATGRRRAKAPAAK